MGEPVVLDANVMAAMADSGGRLSANDAHMVVLQRAGSNQKIATFDENLAAVDGFIRFA